MRAVVQRVSEASVTVDGRKVGQIATGLLVLLGVAREDSESDADYLVDKVTRLRVFPDENGRMNRSVIEAEGELLVISQFTLFGDCRRGKRPSFDQAAAPELARSLYEYYVANCREQGISVQTGVFQAEMDVELINDGPVTILLDSAKLF